MYLKNKNTSKNKKLKVLLLVGLLIVVAAASAGAWYFTHRSTPKPADQTSQQARPEVNKVDYSPAKSTDKVQDSAKDNIAKPTSEGQDTSTPTPSPLSATISSATQQDATVMIRTLVNGTTSGTCTLTASLAGQPSITRTAPLNAQASYVICQGFNIATADFPASGNWLFQVKVDANGSSATAKTNVEVHK